MTTEPWERDDPAWPVHDAVVAWETPFFEGGYDAVERPDGERANYYWLQPSNAAIVLAVTGDDELVLVEQYRPRLRAHTIGLPAGGIEDDEEPAAAARRELREETGFDPAGVSILEDFWVATGVLRHRRAIAFAEGLEPVDRNLDDNEFLTVTSIPVDEALGVARSEPANDATIEGLLLAREDGLL